MRALHTLMTMNIACFLIYGTVSAQKPELTQKASVSCSRFGMTNSLTFTLDVQTDRVDLVYTVDRDNPLDVSAGVFDSNGKGIDGNGTSANPYTFTVSCRGSPPDVPMALDPVSSQIRKAYIMPPDVIAVDVMAKSIYQAPFLHEAQFVGDRIYRPMCNFSQISEFSMETTVTTPVTTTVAETVTNPVTTAETTPVTTATEQIPRNSEEGSSEEDR